MKSTIVCVTLLFLSLTTSLAIEPVPTATALMLFPASSGKIINHEYYSLEYSEENEQAKWVFYRLTSNLVNGNAVRKDNFKEDPTVPTGSALVSDYEGSGYDRGHLCPAASMMMNQKAMDESFYMSNMSPQHPSLNRGRWKALETKEREWTLEKGDIYIVTGPVFKNNITTIGKEKVTVPGYYYKIIYHPKGQMIGFIMPNKKCELELEKYIVTVDSIESFTAIDFFKGLDNATESKLESKVNFSYWFN